MNTSINAADDQISLIKISPSHQVLFLPVLREVNRCQSRPIVRTEEIIGYLLDTNSVRRHYVGSS